MTITIKLFYVSLPLSIPPPSFLNNYFLLHDRKVEKLLFLGYFFKFDIFDTYMF